MSFKEWYARNRQSVLARQAQYRAGLTKEQQVAKRKAKREYMKANYARRRQRLGIKPLAEYLASIPTRSKEHLRNSKRIHDATREVGLFLTRIHRHHPLLQCSPSHFRKHIQSLFRDGMSWENYGKRGIWEFDHILPLDSFDLADPPQVLKAAHFSNVRPLLRSENVQAFLEFKKTQPPQITPRPS